MDRQEAKSIIEALLFVSDKPISIDTLKEVLKDVEPTDVRSITEELNQEYAKSGRSFSIKEIAGGFQMLTDPVYSKWISALYKRPQDRLTGPALETLAIIAYKQPIKRVDLEAIRGAASGELIRALMERSLVKIAGSPLQYGTTKDFLDAFGINSLEDLPRPEEVK